MPKGKPDLRTELKDGGGAREHIGRSSVEIRRQKQTYGRRREDKTDNLRQVGGLYPLEFISLARIPTMEDRFNTPQTVNIELEFLGHNLQLAQDPNSKHLGTTVWDASIVFVKFLERNCKKGEFSNLKLAGKKVIEVGAGCGLAGLGMALLGCHVVATDQIEVLPLLSRNIKQNMAQARQSPSENPHLGSLGTIEVAELDWGNLEQIRALNPPFDYIIGTDIVYKEQLLEPLLASFLRLSGPKTSIMIANEFRSSTVHEKMLELWKKNFDVKLIPKSKMDTKYQHASIQLFNLRPKLPSSIILHEQCHKIAVKDPSEQDSAWLGDSRSLNGSKGSERMPSSSTNLGLGREEQTLQIHEADEKLGVLSLGDEDPDKKDTWDDSGCSNGPNDWEIRRLGSMAARLFQNVL